MPIKENVIKGWITTVIGTATMILSLVLVFTRVIDFMWEGTTGLVIGCLLLMAPKTIEKKVSDAIRYMAGRSKIPDSCQEEGSKEPINDK